MPSHNTAHLNTVKGMHMELTLNNGITMPALQQGRSAIPKLTNPARIAENFDVFDFELGAAELAAIDALDTGVRNGPDPDVARPERFAMVIPEA